ncbi:tRNA (adenosine(37)-N6)-dimethylallyltransferase MiaA [Candidatus Daviesbacteria bacterium]|nr:tRNA (adenosine(37)-N6)-dimethylallyltransferase MiaA [Candidatus Daviesbacteria bacterium]
MSKKIVVILGPTATGKTDLALNLAKKLNGELISCDSRQVYKGLDLGSGKMPNQPLSVKKRDGFWEIEGVKVWMYDCVSLNKRFSVRDYIDLASKKAKELSQQDRLPIVVGGSGLYLKGLLEGISNLQVPIDKQLRHQLEDLTLGQLQQKLIKQSPQSWDNLNSSDRSNKRRLLRSIEVATMYPYRRKDNQFSGLSKEFKILKVGLFAPRPILNKRIDYRIFSRLQQGMIKEVENLIQSGVTFEKLHELGLEYRILAKYLKERLPESWLIETLKVRIHQYAKRQMTWFKKVKDVNWFDITKLNYSLKVEKLIQDWYNA